MQVIRKHVVWTIPACHHSADRTNRRRQGVRSIDSDASMV